MIRAKSVSIDEYIETEWEFDTERPDEDRDAVVAEIARWSRPGQWLDLGCGPMLAAWPLFCSGDCTIFGLDRDTEVAKFYSSIRGASEETWPTGLREAAAFANKRFPRLDARQRKLSELNIAEIVTENLLVDQPRWHRAFDTTVQIGCFGCLTSIAEVNRAFCLAGNYLRTGGRLISATWIPRSILSESQRWGGSVSLDLQLDELVHGVVAAGLTCLHSYSVCLADGEHQFRHIIVAERCPD